MQANQYPPRLVPEPLQGLIILALDLRWNWYHGGDRLWRRVDPEQWGAGSNPWLLLQTVSDQRLRELAADKGFCEELQRQLAERDSHFDAVTWFSSTQPPLDGYVAYFSMEFGLSESLPIYSGGLGVLAGDFLKTACDLGVPMVGVGLLYQQGYFRQALNARGEQIEFHPYNDPTMLPLVPLRDDDGEWVRVRIDLPGRALQLRTWQVRVGRRTLFLLDSNDPLNDPGDRGITSELYGGGSEMRLQQEIALGIGGWRLLEQLGMRCPVCHLNEGHAALVVLERARWHRERNGCSFREALRATRAGNLFTSHTPVAAGFDRFEPELAARYLRIYAQRLGLELEELLALGRVNPDDRHEAFTMAALAVRGSGAVNGVSELHGAVSRQIMQRLFPRWPAAEVPAGHVTNGIHVPTWDSAAADKLWTSACGKARWRGALETVEEDLRRIGDAELWQLRTASRANLVTFLRERTARQNCGRSVETSHHHDCSALFDPDVLTIGFARRFAEYKRPNLLLHDEQRLLRLLTDRDRPVQLVLAGKAHPRDAEGKRMLREWHCFLQRPELQNRAVFIEDYDLGVAEQLVQGIDLWVNTPRRSWEACGTSGMKVLVNGGLNLSELDGWWAEAYQQEVGWALGDGAEHTDIAAWDAMEAEQLYRLLEQDVVPCFYRRDARGVPVGWVERMRESMAHLTTRFSSNRMLREYTERYYLPMAQAFASRDNAAAAALEQWHDQLERHWSQMHFGNFTGTESAEGWLFEVQVYLDDMPPEVVSVELYADANGAHPAARIPLERGPALLGASNAFTYRGSVSRERPAKDYTPRIVPSHATAAVPLEANFISWLR